MVKKKNIKSRTGKALTNEITANLLAWFRFVKGYGLIATEVGYRWKSDVLAQDIDELIEVEVKISYTDMKNEFKKIKHKHYKNATKRADIRRYIPTKFYICVPENLKDKAIEVIDKLNTNYGLIIFTDVRDVTKEKQLHRATSANLRIHKRAKVLYKATELDFEHIRKLMIARITSKLANLYCSKEILK